MQRSHFDGTVFQLIGYSLLASLLTTVTLGIAYPWALCMLQNWETKHTIIESKRLKFDGNGLQLLGMWIMLAMIPLVVLVAALFLMRQFIMTMTQSGSSIAGLIIIALIIAALFYGYFVRIQIKKWIISHTEFEVHISPYAPAADIQQGPVPGPAPNTIPYRPYEKDWVDKIQPALPLIYTVWFCGIAADTWGLLSLIFK